MPDNTPEQVPRTTGIKPAAGNRVNTVVPPWVTTVGVGGVIEPLPPSTLGVTTKVSAKLAVTVRAWSIVTVQVSAVPEQDAPPQPRKVLLACGVAVSVTEVPSLKDALHVAPQFTPAGFEVTAPGPDVATLNGKVGTKLAVTVRAWSIVTVQVVVATPAQAPPQLTKALLACGVAVSVTKVPLLKDAVHVAPQFTPAGLEVTDPGPVAATSSTKVAGAKPAVTLLVWLMGKVQVAAVPAAAQAPPHPVNVWPAVAEAVRVMGVLGGTDMVALEQAAPQLMPAGDEDTVPVPAPVLARFRSTPTAYTLVTTRGPVRAGTPVAWME